MTDQGREADAGRNRPRARRASVPLHRLRQDHRRGRTHPDGQARRRGAGGGRQRRRRPAAQALSGRRTGARRAAVRRRHRRARTALRRRRAVGARARARSSRSTSPRRWRCPASSPIATAKDVPGERWIGQIYADWPCFVAEGEEARCVGDVLAAVAAETPRIAREAAKLIEVAYEPLPAGARPRRSAEARRAARQPQA